MEYARSGGRRAVRRLARESCGAARIDDLREARLARAHTSAASATPAALKCGVKIRGAGSMRPCLERAFLGAPLLQPALQNLDVRRAKEAQRPPDPGGADERGRVIDDEAHAVAKAELSRRAGEILGRGKHMRQASRMVGDGVDVEENGPGDVAGEIFRPRIANSPPA